MNRALLASRLASVDVAHDRYARALSDALMRCAYSEGPVDVAARERDFESVHTCRMAYMLALELLARVVRNELSGGDK